MVGDHLARIALARGGRGLVSHAHQLRRSSGPGRAAKPRRLEPARSNSWRRILPWTTIRDSLWIIIIDNGAWCGAARCSRNGGGAGKSTRSFIGGFGVKFV